jgi:SAM-dependent methyltransferase
VALVDAIKGALAHPLTRGVSIDDPRATALRRRIVREKPFLRKVYAEWYGMLAEVLPPRELGAALELGSGAGFLKEFVRDVVTSEIFVTPGIDVVLDGQRLPLADESLRAIVMTDVMHHLPRVRLFFAEATRTVKRGGVIAMIEPWVSGWSKCVYTKLHHEPFEPEAPAWEFPTSGPLSGANGALPWMVFVRDRELFEREFPQWQIEGVRPIMPLAYLVSGGVSMRSLMPGWSYGVWRGVEGMMSPLNRQLAMFAMVVLRKTGDVQSRA